MELPLADEETKMWRFRAQVFVRQENDTPFRFQNPVPVYSERKLVGFASIWVPGRTVLADVVVQYGIPERMDVDTGKKVYLDAWFRVDPNKPRNLYQLTFNNTPGPFQGEPIGTPLLEP